MIDKHADKQPSALCVIPAKGKSTRLPRKNILPLGNKPLLAWVGEAARDSGVFQRIIISTEDEEIASVARAHGFDVPFMRPEKLSVDPAGVQDVALHALELLERAGEHYAIVAVMMPTCPFVASRDVQGAWKMFLQQGHEHPVLFTASEYDHPPQRALLLDDKNLGHPLSVENIHKRTQEFPRAVYPNGAVVLAWSEWLKDTRNFHAAAPLCHVMPRLRSIDIDTPEDYEIARIIHAGMQHTKS